MCKIPDKSRPDPNKANAAPVNTVVPYGKGEEYRNQYSNYLNSMLSDTANNVLVDTARPVSPEASDFHNKITTLNPVEETLLPNDTERVVTDMQGCIKDDESQSSKTPWVETMEVLISARLLKC